MSIVYKHSYDPLSMYGNVVALLREHISTTGVHLDIGCGYGAIAEPIRDELGLVYLGFDLAEDGLQSLNGRGFDTHVIDLSELPHAEAIIKRAIQHRPIASISFLDTMEHLTNGPDVLAMLRRLADGSKAPLVISVPNITHKDVAIKLLLGRLDVTEAGILDHTHFSLFSEGYLKRVTASRGWSQVSAKDWLLEQSDQSFPSDLAALDHRTPIGGKLRSLSMQANRHALVNQFVRAYLPGEALPLDLYDDRSEPKRPFLSILVDAYQMDADEIARILHDMESQTNQDFNVVLVIDSALGASASHSLSHARSIFDGRITMLESNEAVRAERLNHAETAISGQFMATLIAGDRLSEDWVASFAALAKDGRKAVLHVRRTPTSVHDSLPPREAILSVPTRGTVSVAEWAVPGSAIRDLGVGFDPNIGTADLRDFVIQSAILYGVGQTPELEASQVDNDSVVGGEKIDDDSSLALLTKLNANPLLLPSGSAERVERLSKVMDGLLPLGSAEMTEQLADSLRIADLVAASPLLSRFIASFPHRSGHEDQPAEDNVPQPFLSVIMRTQGAEARIGTLREAILTLAGQSSQNFEVLLVVHSDDEDRFSSVRDLVAQFPVDLTQRVRILKCDRLGRASPLNLAIDHARGQYVAVFDDDDLLFAHWVETFEELAQKAPGAMLRAVTARQDFKMLGAGGSERSRGESWFQLAWHSEYDAVEHLRTNFTPFMSMAFPIAAFREIGLRFDESLSTAEDWQLSTRVAMLCGVHSAPDITAVYRWWTNGHSSSLLVPRDEWEQNRQQVLARLNRQPVLLPPGSTEKIVDLIDEVLALRRRVNAYEREQSDERELPAAVHHKASSTRSGMAKVDRKKRDRAQRRLKELLESRSWRSTKPFRLTVNLLRGRTGSGLTASDMPKSVEANQRLINEIHKSASWRITAPLRVIGILTRRLTGRN
ncbi:glycosyltransferase [Microvirga sp. RSM25]|uniref:glycosyltransferase n=1 Tax=Microvirga sp. RSM25 TaxID=3273802 RepID=UPI003850FE12